MPIYEYEGDGRRILLRRPVEQRNDPLVIDGRPWRRLTVPSRVTVGTGARPETMSDKTRKGYRHLELAGKLDDRPGYLSANRVKEALAMPDTAE